LVTQRRRGRKVGWLWEMNKGPLDRWFVCQRRKNIDREADFQKFRKEKGKEEKRRRGGAMGAG